MHKNEFVEKMIGVPWVNRAHSFEAVDCYGLVLMYYKHVVGDEINIPDGYEAGDYKNGCYINWTLASGFKETKARGEGNIIGMFKGERLAHVGVMIDAVNVLHCRGDLEKAGHVECHSLRSLSKFFTSVKIYTRE